MTPEIRPAAGVALSARRRVIAALWLALACTACASARVENVQADHSLNLQRPARIVVFDFNTGTADVALPPLDGSDSAPALALEQPDLLAEAVADRVAARLVENIASLGLPAERVVAGAALPEVNDLVIEGDFVRVDAGSRTLRFVIGFGAGASELRTRVRIFRVTAEGWAPVQQFETVATSSRLPGVAAGAAAGSAATSAGFGALREFRSAINADAGRTAEQIAGRVADLKTAQSW